MSDIDPVLTTYNDIRQQVNLPTFGGHGVKGVNTN